MSKFEEVAPGILADPDQLANVSKYSEQRRKEREESTFDPESFAIRIETALQEGNEIQPHDIELFLLFGPPRKGEIMKSIFPGKTPKSWHEVADQLKFRDEAAKQFFIDVTDRFNLKKIFGED